MYIYIIIGIWITYRRLRELKMGHLYYINLGFVVNIL